MDYKSKFRTVELSDPRFETNNLRHITVKSKNLKSRGDITLFVPEGKYENLPIVLLLHGVYGSHWTWSQRTGIHLKMQSWINNGEVTPMIIAMPSDGLWGDGSGYLPHTNMDYEKWIVEDVINVTIESIPEASKSSKLFIAGLSMGGFGALRLGAKYGHLFLAFSGLSSITVLEEMKLFVEEELSSLRQKNRVNESVFETILKHRDTLPKFRFDCGISDELLEGNRKLHHQLEKNNIPHIYKEYSGAHEWLYWEEHIKETIVFFNGEI
jgi:enterochelin esterase-like enzyme